MNTLSLVAENIIMDYKEDLEKLSECKCCCNEYNPVDLNGRNECEDCCYDCYCDFCECNYDDCNCFGCEKCDVKNDSEYMFYCDGCEGHYCSCMGIDEDFIQINDEKEKNYCKKCIKDKLKIQENYGGEYTFYFEGEEISGKDICTIHINSVYHWTYHFYDTKNGNYHSIINDNFDIEVKKIQSRYIGDDKRNMKTLRKLCKEKGLKGFSKLKKQELIDLLNN
tara:strand:- start:1169 stop:1837 length:669 start_codon:yes stop_codon:yes gene_type:complete